MEGRRQDDRVVRFRWQGPTFEGRYRDSDVRKAGQFSTRHGGKVRPHLDGGDVVLPLSEQKCRLARSGADLQDASSWTEIGIVGEIVEELGAVAWARTIVELGGFIEDRPEWRYFIPVVAPPPTK